MVLSQSRAETRAFGRRFAAASVSNRVSVAPVAVPQADAERSGLVRGGNVSGLFVCKV